MDLCTFRNNCLYQCMLRTFNSIISMLIFENGYNINNYLEYHYMLWTNPVYVGTRRLMVAYYYLYK